ncbi:MAG: FkbM family methyltransferase [Ginsengibacter sp.]
MSKDNPLKRLVYIGIRWYVRHFKFPFRGEKYFSSLLKYFSLYRSTYIKKLHNGQLISVVPEDHIQRTLLWYGFYEKDSILTWEKLIGQDSVVIDIGTNIGYYTLIAAQKARNGKVYSFEPVAVNFQALQQNLKLNNITNVIAYQAGISNARSVAKYFVSSPDNRGMSGMRPAPNFSGLVESIETMTLDEFSRDQNLKKIDFIKLDIEGNELNALHGMLEVLKKFKPVLFIELLGEHLAGYGAEVKDVYHFLKENGYDPCQIHPDGSFNFVNTEDESEMMMFVPAGGMHQ